MCGWWTAPTLRLRDEATPPVLTTCSLPASGDLNLATGPSLINKAHSWGRLFPGPDEEAGRAGRQSAISRAGLSVRVSLGVPRTSSLLHVVSLQMRAELSLRARFWARLQGD